MQTTAYTHDGKATMVIEGPIVPERIVDVWADDDPWAEWSMGQAAMPQNGRKTLTEWQPIETLVKEHGVKFLARIVSSSGKRIEYTVMEWRNEEDAAWFIDGLELSNAFNPTHWMPLPEPPAQEEG